MIIEIITDGSEILGTIGLYKLSILFTILIEYNTLFYSRNYSIITNDKFIKKIYYRIVKDVNYDNLSKHPILLYVPRNSKRTEVIKQIVELVDKYFLLLDIDNFN